MSEFADDFGSIHHGMSLITEQLAAMGESRYRSYLAGSLYDYRFGNIQVTYLGVAFSNITWVVVLPPSLLTNKIQLNLHNHASTPTP